MDRLLEMARQISDAKAAEKLRVEAASFHERAAQLEARGKTSASEAPGRST
jgi:hypothetical protein